MSTLTTLNPNDTGSVSRGVINANFTSLNTDKAELASPIFTGTPSLPTGTTGVTQSAGNNSTKLATTAYVDGTSYTATSGVSAGPAASSTQTVTHGLGRVPTVIRVSSSGSTNTSGGGGHSSGTYNSTGNRCVYFGASNGARDSATSTTYAVRLAINSSGSEANVTTGIIQNVTSTSFEIVWTCAGSVTTGAFVWEAN